MAIKSTQCIFIITSKKNNIIIVDYLLFTIFTTLMYNIYIYE